jgi:hypothetical protein
MEEKAMAQKPRIGLIGAGRVGSAVSTAAVERGYEVLISNSREPETLRKFVEELGPLARMGSPTEAAEFGDIVLIAVPFHAYQILPVGPLARKVIVDANNYFTDRDGQFTQLVVGEITSSELIAAHMPESKIVKAFNVIRAAEILTDALETGHPHRRALPIAGDDAEAKRIVASVIGDFGFDVVDFGALSLGRQFEPGTQFFDHRMTAEEMKLARQ